MAEDTTIRFTVSLNENLLNALDSQVSDGKFASRSEYIRDLIREQMIDKSWRDGDDEVVGVLTLIYDHHQRELQQKMTDIQHDSSVDILCTTHVHIDHHNCLETIMIRGTPAKIESVASEIGGLKGINFSKLTKTTVF